MSILDLPGREMSEATSEAPLLHSPLFRGIPRADLASVAASFGCARFEASELIVREGDRGDSLFVIETGMVEVCVSSGRGPDSVLLQLGPGEAFGEMAVLTGQPRSAAVRAIVPTTVRSIPRDDFLALAGRQPVLLFNLSRVLAGRLLRAGRTTTQAQGAQVVGIAGRVPPIVGSLIATNLTAALSAVTRRRVLLVDVDADHASNLPGRDQIPELAGVWTKSAGELRVPSLRFGAARFKAVSLPEAGGLLDAVRPLTLEEAVSWMRKSADFVVLNLTAERPSELKIALSQVDRAYLIATTPQLSSLQGDEVLGMTRDAPEFLRGRVYPVIMSGEGSSLAEIRQQTVSQLGIPARAILPGQVQLLRDAARDSGPLAIRAPLLAFSRSMRWLARDVAHLKVGVALGAGGARGFAHVGVFRVMQEREIPLDYIAGTSMGAVIGAPAALGMSMAQGEEVMLRLHKKFTSLMRPTLALMTSLLSPKGVEETFRELVGDATFEELPVPFAAVAADLETARPVVFKEGSLADAIRASSAIPGFWPPKVIGNHRLVDGSVLNPVPTQAVRDLGADIVIAVDISGRVTDDESPTRPRLSKQPNIFQNLHRCLDIMMADRALRDCLLADVVIRPRFETISWDKFDRASSYADAGYEAASDALPALRRLLPWLGE